MLRSTILCLAAALTFAWLAKPLAVRADDNEMTTKWLVDFEKAKKEAAKHNLDILMEFTGSDWCPPCKALHKNVLTKEAFQKTVPKHFILLKLDNRRDKSKQSKEEIQQYKDLSKRFAIRGVPTILLADATGKPYAKQVGYGGQNAEAYTEGLVKKTTVRKERDKYLAKAKKAKGVERAKLLAKAIKNIGSELALTEYRDTVDEIIKLDANNKANLKAKYENLARLSDINKELNAIQAANRSNPKAAAEKIDALVKRENLTGETLQSAMYMKGAILYRTDKQASRRALEEAMRAAPDTSRASQIRRILNSPAFKNVKKEKTSE